MQSSALKLSRLDFVFGPGDPIDDFYFDSAVADAVAQFGGKVPLNLFAA